MVGTSFVLIVVAVAFLRTQIRPILRLSRAAEAFGATGLIFVKGTVSPFHPKTLRASAGSLFRVPFLRGMTLIETRDLLTGRAALLAAVPFHHGAPAASECDLTVPLAFIIGSEGQGIRDESLRDTHPIAIPTHGVESLNAATAASILLYEAARQRIRP